MSQCTRGMKHECNWGFNAQDAFQERGFVYSLIVCVICGAWAFAGPMEIDPDDLELSEGEET